MRRVGLAGCLWDLELHRDLVFDAGDDQLWRRRRDCRHFLLVVVGALGEVVGRSMEGARVLPLAMSGRAPRAVGIERVVRAG